MRDLYLLRMRLVKMEKAQQKAVKDPEYQELEKQVKELIDKRDAKLHELTKKYYEEMKEEP